MPNAPNIAIVAALRREIDDLLSRSPILVQHLLGSKGPTYVIGSASFTCAGIGRDAAGKVSDAVIRQLRPELIVSVGFAGAADPILELGDVVTPSAVIDSRSGTTFSTLGGEGVLVSADKIVDKKEKSRLRQLYGAVAVDMEAAAVAERARYYGIPFLAVKSISDTAETTLPDLSRFVQEDGGFATTSFLMYLLFRPTLWRAVSRIALNSRVAARSLASSLRRLLADKSLVHQSNSSAMLNSR